MPAAIADGDGALIYVSLGSLGSADVPLMERLVEALAKTPHRYVVSKGPQHDAYELADNMVGEEFLPQVSVLPQVDLVITHGGNNTVTECMHFGKPMVRPADLLGPARQRAASPRDGVRGPASRPTRSPTRRSRRGDRRPARRRDALHAKLGEISKRLQANPGNDRAADLIERLAETGEPVTD